MVACQSMLAIGDVSFYHDMNGLLAARRHDLDLLIVLINNDGGGIFSFLPQAAHQALGGKQVELAGADEAGLRIEAVAP